MKTRTILLATDGSDTARKAQDYLVDTYDPETCEILVVSVASPPEVVLGYAGSTGSEAEMLGREPGEIRDEITEEYENLAEETARNLKDEGFDCEVAVPIGNPGEEIVELAQGRDVYEVVIGRQGRGRIGELLLGSVSQYVVHHVRCPVTLISYREESE